MLKILGKARMCVVWIT